MSESILQFETKVTVKSKENIGGVIEQSGGCFIFKPESNCIYAADSLQLIVEKMKELNSSQVNVMND